MLLRNLLRRSPTSKLIAGTPKIGIDAATIIAETATGDQGPGLLYDDALANAGKQLRVKITSWSGTPGTLFVYENGSILIQGQADGSYVIGYDREAWASDGSVSIISDTATVTIGPVNASVSAGEGVSTGSGTGGSASATTSATAVSGEGIGVVSGSGGNAVGGVAGNGDALGGTGTGTGSGSGGDATGGAGSNASVEAGSGTSAGSGEGGTAIGDGSASAPGGTGTGAGSGSGGSAHNSTYIPTARYQVSGQRRNYRVTR